MNVLKKILILLIFIVLAGVVLFYAAAPRVLEALMISQMRQAGLEKPELRVESVSFKGISLSRISSKQPRMGIEFAAADFSLRGLIQGRVDHVQISGLSYFIEVTEHGLDTGLPASQGRGDGLPLVVPFKDMKISSSALVVKFRDRDYLIPFSVQAELRDDQVLSYDLWTHFLGQPVSLQGQSDMATMETRAHVRALWSDFMGPGGWHESSELMPLPGPGGLEAVFNLELTMDAAGKGGAKINARADAHDFHLQGPGLKIDLEKGSFAVRAELDDELFFDEFDLDLNLAGLGFNDNLLESLSLSLGQAGARVDFSAAVARPLRLSFEARGEQSSINDLLKPEVKYLSEIKWRSGFELPADADWLPGPLWMEFDRDLRAGAHGRLRAGFSRHENQMEKSWFVQVESGHARVEPFSLFIPEYDLEAAGLKVEAPFFIQAQPGRTYAGLTSKARISLERLLMGQEEQAYSLSAVNLGSYLNSPLATLQRLRDGSLALSWQAVQDGELSLASADVLTRIQELKMSGDLEINAQGEYRGNMRFTPQMSLVSLKNLGLEIEDVHVDLPVGFGDKGVEPGAISTGAVKYLGLVFPGIKGRMAVSDYRLQSRGQWPFVPGTELDFDLDLMLDAQNKISGRVSAHADWFDLPEHEITTLVPAFKEMSIDGRARFSLALEVHGPLISPLVQLEIEDASVAYPVQEIKVSGITGTVTVDDFFPLTTPGNQRIDIKRLSLGLVELEDGFLSFRVESPESFFLEKTRWYLPEGGFIAAHSSRFDLGERGADLEIFFEDIDLLSLVARISQEKIVGSGLVYGRVPLLYRQNRVTLGDGFLHSVPGTGRLGIRDEDWLETLLGYVRDAMRDHPYLSVVSERLEQALRDFEYNFLSVRLKPGLLDTAARIELRGRGVEGDPPQEVGSLVININDLGEIVNRVLRFQLTRDESIERALEDFFSF